MTWVAPSDCVAGDTLLSEVAQLVGDPQPRAPLRVRAEVTRDATNRWHVALTVEGQRVRSERVFDADSCVGAASAAALIVAVAFDADTKPSATISSSEVAPLALSRPRAVPPMARASSSRTTQLDLGLGAIGEYGASPAFAPGVEAAAGMAHGWLGGRARVRLIASGEYYAPQTDAQQGHPESARFQLFAVSGRGCVSLLSGRVDIGPCLGTEFDALSGKGIGGAATFVSREGTATWVALTASILASLRLTTDLGVFLRVDGLLPLDRPRFDIVTPTGQTAVEHPSAVAAHGAFGVELRFF